MRLSLANSFIPRHIEWPVYFGSILEKNKLEFGENGSSANLQYAL